MKQRRTAALSRHQAPAFVLLGGLELMQLRKLSDLAFRMFLELLAMADHVTGRVSTSYAVLAALMDFDQAPTANTAPRPTLKRLRVALEDLAALRLVTVDRIKNEKAKGLFLKVQPRTGISAPANKQGRQQGRPRNGQEQALARVSGPRGSEAGQTAGQGVQEVIPPPAPSLSTGPTAPPAHIAASLAAVKDRVAARGKARAPEGA